jgi:hypothetical protein
MEMPTTVVWADDALERQDLGEFRTRLDATIERGFRRLRRTLSLVIIGGFVVNITAIVAATAAPLSVSPRRLPGASPP